MEGKPCVRRFRAVASARKSWLCGLLLLLDSREIKLRLIRPNCCAACLVAATAYRLHVKRPAVVAMVVVLRWHSAIHASDRAVQRRKHAAFHRSIDYLMRITAPEKIRMVRRVLLWIAFAADLRCAKCYWRHSVESFFMVDAAEPAAHNSGPCAALGTTATIHRVEFLWLHLCGHLLRFRRPNVGAQG